MTLQARLILAFSAMWIACGDNGGGETTAQPMTTTGQTTGTPTTTGDTTGTPTTGSAESSSGEPAHSCLVYTDKATCKQDSLCTWKGVIGFVNGAQGCQGTITDRCVDLMAAGGASAWYRGPEGNEEVVEFAYTPTDLDPEWQPCTCDGPLACLCTSVTEACPDRLEQFCSAVTTADGCKLAKVGGDLRCAWLSVSAEGPDDGMCADGAEVYGCRPAEAADAVTCMPPAYTFMPCAGYSQEVFWRDRNGIIEVVTACGPQPIGWTRCEADDTPEQPDECKCRCL